jgi:hypothetical protein
LPVFAGLFHVDEVLLGLPRGLLRGSKGGCRWLARPGQGLGEGFRWDEIPVKKVQGIALLQGGRGHVLGAARLAAATTTTPAPGAAPGFAAALAAFTTLAPGRGRWSGWLLIVSLTRGGLGAWLRTASQGPGSKRLFTPGLITPDLLALHFLTPGFFAAWFVTPGRLLCRTLPGSIPVTAATGGSA